MKKLLSVLLSLALLVGLATTAFAVPDTEVITVVEDGVTYTITAYDTISGEREVIITSDDNKDKTVIAYAADKELTIVEYEYTGSVFLGLIAAYDKESLVFDLSDMAAVEEQVAEMDEIFAQAISWGSVVNITPFHYGYKFGNEGSKTWLQIAKSKESYRINYTTVNKTGKGYCDTFVNAIKDFRASRLGALIAWGAGGTAAMGAIALLFAASILTGGIVAVIGTAAVALVGGAIGGYKITLSEIKTAYQAYRNAADAYIKCKSYGVKV